MIDIIKDVSTLTTIQEKHLNRLINLGIYSICDAVEDSILEGEVISELDIGIGQLTICCDNSEVKFKFIPSAKLREEVINTIKNKENVLENKLKESIVEKITSVYKDII